MSSAGLRNRSQVVLSIVYPLSAYTASLLGNLRFRTLSMLSICVTQMSEVPELPDDVWGVIFSKLTYLDCIRIMGVCRQWRDRGYEATSTTLISRVGLVYPAMLEERRALSCQLCKDSLLQLKIVVMTRSQTTSSPPQSHTARPIQCHLSKMSAS